MSLLSDKIIKFLCFFILFFNAVDCWISVYFIRYKNVSENNPLMENLLNMESLMPFTIGKTFLVCSGVYLLYQNRNSIFSQLGMYFCFCTYWGLVLHFYYFLL